MSCRRRVEEAEAESRAISLYFGENRRQEKISYQLSCLDVLKALFLPLDPLGTLLLAGVFLGIPFLTIWGLKAAGEWPRRWWLLAVTISFLLILPLASWPQAGSGWRLTDEGLELKAWPVSATLDLKGTRAALVDSSSPWRPVVRTNGYGTPGLCTGWCKLANGRKAVVFRHLRPSRMAVLESQGRYYVLAHPGVEELYRLLLARGVKQGAL